MTINGNELKKRIISAIKSQGFTIEGEIKAKNNEKNTLKKIQEKKRKEQLKLHKNFLLENITKAQQFSISGNDVNPHKIELELIELKKKSDFYSKLFLWWNLVWWSIPYERPIGRQMRYLIWDKYHNAPFGLFYLQSPPIRSGVRDRFLGLNNGNNLYWVNQSLYGQRIGALPPYNELLGGKLVALSLTSNEVRDAYRIKYENKITLIEKHVIPNRLLFITTTSAFGKSSVYERIKYKDQNVSQFLGYTSGAGTFHISEELYKECLQFLEQNGIDIKRGYGTGPSRKLKLLSKAFSLLGIPNYNYHNIKRGYYLFSNVENLHQIIHENSEPIYYDRPFNDLFYYWLERWCIPRSVNSNKWKCFDSKKYIKNINNLLKKL